MPRFGISNSKKKPRAPLTWAQRMDKNRYKALFRDWFRIQTTLAHGIQGIRPTPLRIGLAQEVKSAGQQHLVKDRGMEGGIGEDKSDKSSSFGGNSSDFYSKKDKEKVKVNKNGKVKDRDGKQGGDDNNNSYQNNLYIHITSESLPQLHPIADILFRSLSLTHHSIPLHTHTLSSTTSCSTTPAPIPYSSSSPAAGSSNILHVQPLSQSPFLQTAGYNPNNPNNPDCSERSMKERGDSSIISSQHVQYPAKTLSLSSSHCQFQKYLFKPFSPPISTNSSSSSQPAFNTRDRDHANNNHNNNGDPCTYDYDSYGYPIPPSNNTNNTNNSSSSSSSSTQPPPHPSSQSSWPSHHSSPERQWERGRSRESRSSYPYSYHPRVRRSRSLPCQILPPKSKIKIKPKNIISDLDKKNSDPSLNTTNLSHPHPHHHPHPSPSAATQDSPQDSPTISVASTILSQPALTLNVEAEFPSWPTASGKKTAKTKIGDKEGGLAGPKPVVIARKTGKWGTGRPSVVKNTTNIIKKNSKTKDKTPIPQPISVESSGHNNNSPIPPPSSGSHGKVRKERENNDFKKSKKIIQREGKTCDITSDEWNTLKEYLMLQSRSLLLQYNKYFNKHSSSSSDHPISSTNSSSANSPKGSGSSGNGGKSGGKNAHDNHVNHLTKRKSRENHKDGNGYKFNLNDYQDLINLYDSTLKKAFLYPPNHLINPSSPNNPKNPSEKRQNNPKNHVVSTRLSSVERPSASSSLSSSVNNSPNTHFSASSSNPNQNYNSNFPAKTLISQVNLNPPAPFFTPKQQVYETEGSENGSMISDDVSDSNYLNNPNITSDNPLNNPDNSQEFNIDTASNDYNNSFDSPDNPDNSDNIVIIGTGAVQSASMSDVGSENNIQDVHEHEQHMYTVDNPNNPSFTSYNHHKKKPSQSFWAIKSAQLRRSINNPNNSSKQISHNNNNNSNNNNNNNEFPPLGGTRGGSNNNNNNPNNGSSSPLSHHNISTGGVGSENNDDDMMINLDISLDDTSQS